MGAWDFQTSSDDLLGVVLQELLVEGWYSRQDVELEEAMAEA